MTNDDKGLATLPAVGAVMKIAEDELDLIKNAYAPGVTDMDFKRYIAEAEHRGLDPVLREIWAIPGFGKDKDTGQPKPAIIMPSINGYRKLADLTGLVDGTEGPFFCGSDGKWVEVWLEEKFPPSAAQFRVYRKDRRIPTVATVTFKQRAKRYANGGLMGKWAETPAEMLGINAERDAWKRSGLIHNGQRVSDPDVANRRVHAAAATAGLSHEHVRAVVQSFNPELTSLTEATAEEMHAAADLIEAVGTAAIPADPTTGELVDSGERQAFLDWVQKVVSERGGAKEWQAIRDDAGDTAWKWQIMIEHATTFALAEKLAALAIKEGLPEAFIAGCVLTASDRSQIKDADTKRDRPVVAEKEKPDEVGEQKPVVPVEPTIKTWPEFFKVLGARGMDAGAYEALVGSTPKTFATPDEAMQRLIVAEAEIDGALADEDGDGDSLDDGDFRELDDPDL